MILGCIDMWLASYSCIAHPWPTVNLVWKYGIGLSWFLGEASCKVTLVSFPSTPSHETTKGEMWRRWSRQDWMYFFFFPRSREWRTASGFRWMLNGAARFLMRKSRMQSVWCFQISRLPRWSGKGEMLFCSIRQRKESKTDAVGTFAVSNPCTYKQSS